MSNNFYSLRYVDKMKSWVKNWEYTCTFAQRQENSILGICKNVLETAKTTITTEKWGKKRGSI